MDFQYSFSILDSSWSMLKYPIPKDKRIKLVKLYLHISTTPGMSTQIVATCADALKTLTRSKKKLTIHDMRLPWRPIYDILSQDLFLSRRQFEYTYVFTKIPRGLANFMFLLANYHGAWVILPTTPRGSFIRPQLMKCSLRLYL